MHDFGIENQPRLKIIVRVISEAKTKLHWPLSTSDPIAQSRLIDSSPRHLTHPIRPRTSPSAVIEPSRLNRVDG